MSTAALSVVEICCGEQSWRQLRAILPQITSGLVMNASGGEAKRGVELSHSLLEERGRGEGRGGSCRTRRHHDPDAAAPNFTSFYTW